jgi:hypothetical protein
VRLNEKLHLVVPLYEGGDEATIYAYVHSAPISREAFESHYLLLSKTFTAIFAEGLGEIAGPRVASLVLRDVAKRQKDEEGRLALINEIQRLTNVLIRTSNGWETVPFHEVVGKGTINEDDLAEVTNAIIFFIATSAMVQKQMRKDMLSGAANLWGAQISSLDCGAFAASLRTSIATANTGANPKPASSVAY